MKISFKLLSIMFMVGIIVGLAVSPWIDTRPQDAILSPVSDLYAFGGEFDQEITYKNNNENIMQRYFDKFDREQGFEKSQSAKAMREEEKVLGTLDEKNNEDIKTEEKNITQENASLVVSNKSGRKKIAILGDSMVDTMGTGLPYLSKQLKVRFPNMEFDLLNYGVGSENIITANDRINNNYVYKDRSYPVLSNLGADIIIIESFAYNPIGDDLSDLKKQTEMINSIVGKLKNDKVKIIFLAAISPIKKKFGQGPGGVNWEIDKSWEHATKIQTYLENGIKSASEIGLPIIDCYHATLLPNGEGIASYVSTHDGIHPSVTGEEFMAAKIAEKLVELKAI